MGEATRQFRDQKADRLLQDRPRPVAPPSRRHKGKHRAAWRAHGARQWSARVPSGQRSRGKRLQDQRSTPLKSYRVARAARPRNSSGVLSGLSSPPVDLRVSASWRYSAHTRYCV